MPVSSLARAGALSLGVAIAAAALPSCFTSQSVYIADRASTARIHLGAREALAREGLKEKSWKEETLSGEYTSAKPVRRLLLVVRPLGDGWNIELRAYGEDGLLDKRETGRLRDRLLTSLREEGLDAREGPF